MDANERESLSAYIRSLGIDNFSIADGLLRLGSRSFRVNPCRCGEPSCDGWKLKPSRRPTFATG
ncbi:hypothetical protein [Novosphingobium sp. JCM 18896]|uniref:hypothetical protein n=1 Tax=Novosphingobium sp. JCM 18896 TaxID=2989731 RepID=UPI0022236434|nr:hypothetical protein [Novosphingobium sp. JCM 18896]MCW1430115.1 hypothetical protein [Novosphingobium sp. JCM 18896]